ncbi:putative leucine-rich repeat-containing protein DDB_G0290503 isoform X2 [Aethina tumida]|nr:putative leucine-rich repeat-containing protein DDB_G0290503 isoform X2 [Aethina tumida]
MQNIKSNESQMSKKSPMLLEDEIKNLKATNKEVTQLNAELKMENGYLKDALNEVNKKYLTTKMDYNHLLQVIATITKASIENLLGLSESFNTLQSFIPQASQTNTTAQLNNKSLHTTQTQVVKPSVVNGHVLQTPTISLTRLSDNVQPKRVSKVTSKSTETIDENPDLPEQTIPAIEVTTPSDESENELSDNEQQQSERTASDVAPEGLSTITELSESETTLTTHNECPQIKLGSVRDVQILLSPLPRTMLERIQGEVRNMNKTSFLDISMNASTASSINSDEDSRVILRQITNNNPNEILENSSQSTNSDMTFSESLINSIRDNNEFIDPFDINNLKEMALMKIGLRVRDSEFKTSTPIGSISMSKTRSGSLISLTPNFITKRKIEKREDSPEKRKRGRPKSKEITESQNIAVPRRLDMVDENISCIKKSRGRPKTVVKEKDIHMYSAESQKESLNKMLVTSPVRQSSPVLKKSSRSPRPKRVNVTPGKFKEPTLIKKLRR